MFKFYEVGGCVRDEIMGLKSKDIDYTVVYERDHFEQENKPSASEAFFLLQKYLVDRGYTIWLSSPDCYTLRARFPGNHDKANITADFVLARKELGYIPGTRKPFVAIGSLYDDLERRDFTVNAIAKDENGAYIDYFTGLEDLSSKVLRTPLPVLTTFNDDPLRILRAIRFQITKGLKMTSEMRDVIVNYDYNAKMQVVSEERIREELYKCFKHDSLKTMAILCDFPKLALYVFDNTNLWLKPTNEKQ